MTPLRMARSLIFSCSASDENIIYCIGIYPDGLFDGYNSKHEQIYRPVSLVDIASCS